jgi:hypothetical protein
LGVGLGRGDKRPESVLSSFFLGQDDFSVAPVRLVGVAYWEKPVGDELHVIGHAQISIYDILFNAIRQKWSLPRA